MTSGEQETGGRVNEQRSGGIWGEGAPARDKVGGVCCTSVVACPSGLSPVSRFVCCLWVRNAHAIACRFVVPGSLVKI